MYYEKRKEKSNTYIMEYKVRFVNPQKQYADHRDEFLKAFDETLAKGAIVNRDELKRFEKEFADFIGVKYAVGVNSGTSALDVAMQAAGIGSGDEVITVAHTFIATISTICLAGAKPVLVDAGKDFNMDVNLIEQAITPRTKAIVPVHLNGRLCNMDVIMDIARRHNLIVIEDAAQAPGATFTMADGTVKKAGTFGLVGCFSLYWAKILGGWGNNGVAVTNDPDVAHKLSLMRYNGEDREDRKFYYHAHNLLMDNVHAALLSVKMQYLPQWLERRKEIAERYHVGLENIAQVSIPRFDDPRFSDVLTNYVIRAERRDELRQYLEERGVETLVSWPVPMHEQPLMQPNDINLPETEKICREVISLPIYPELRDDEVDYVVDQIRAFYAG